MGPAAPSCRRCCSWPRTRRPWRTDGPAGGARGRGSSRAAQQRSARAQHLQVGRPAAAWKWGSRNAESCLVPLSGVGGRGGGGRAGHPGQPTCLATPADASSRPSGENSRPVTMSQDWLLLAAGSQVRRHASSTSWAGAGVSRPAHSCRRCHAGGSRRRQCCCWPPPPPPAAPSPRPLVLASGTMWTLPSRDAAPACASKPSRLVVLSTGAMPAPRLRLRCSTGSSASLLSPSLAPCWTLAACRRLPR